MSGDVKVGYSNWFKIVVAFRACRATLGSRFRPPLISCKNTLHLCKGTLIMCRPGLQAPDLHSTIVIFGNP